MSGTFYSDLRTSITKYGTNPSKQINLGWTVTKPWYLVVAVILGLFLITMLIVVLTTNNAYRTGTRSRRFLVILGWVGFALVLIGFWGTIVSFHTLVDRINFDVEQNGPCSLFSEESAKNAVELLASEYNLDHNLKVYVDQEKNKLSDKLQKNGVLRATKKTNAANSLLVLDGPKTPSIEQAETKAATQLTNIVKQAEETAIANVVQAAAATAGRPTAIVGLTSGPSSGPNIGDLAKDLNFIKILDQKLDFDHKVLLESNEYPQVFKETYEKFKQYLSKPEPELIKSVYPLIANEIVKKLLELGVITP